MEASETEATIGTDITEPPYPYYLEYGTPKMAPHPSARPAFDENIDEAKEKVVAVLRDAIGGA